MQANLVDNVGYHIHSCISQQKQILYCTGTDTGNNGVTSIEKTSLADSKRVLGQRGTWKDRREPGYADLCLGGW